MKKSISVILSIILIFGCFGCLASCSLFETPKKPVLDLNFEEYEAGTLLFDAANKNGQFAVYSSGGTVYSGDDQTGFNISVTNSAFYTGEKSMQGTTAYQYVTTPLTLLPNTKYSLSFFYYYTTNDTDCYVSSVEYGVYDLTKSAEAQKMTKASGAGTVTKEAFNETHTPNAWRKIVLDFETYDTTENLVFAYKYTLKNKAGKEAEGVTFFVDDINLAFAENTVKSEVEVKNSTASSVEFITATPQTIFPDDKVEFRVVTAEGLTPEVEVNSDTLTPNEKGIYSFVAKKKVKLEVICDGDDNRRDANVDKNGNDLTKYNADIATLPVWEGDTVYHETALFVPGRETAKLLYPISEAISVRSYDLYTNYIEGLDYEITPDGLIKRLENSRIPLYTGDITTETKNDFPTADGKYLEFINDYSYVKYGIAITYEHKTEWQGEEGYNPVKVESAADKLPKVLEKLKKGEEVNILVYGDSISCGWSSSGLNFVKSIYGKNGEVGDNALNLPPYTPAWPAMLKQELEKLYPNAKINLKILALGGVNSRWGAKNFNERLTYLGEEWSTDLMILCFAANDVYSKISNDDYFVYMQYMVDELRNNTPDAEVLLWSQSLPNLATTVYPVEAFLGYQEELEYIADSNEGVALVKLTDQFSEVIKSKEAIDYLNTNVNHPNDFTTRIIAQGLIAALS